MLWHIVGMLPWAVVPGASSSSNSSSSSNITAANLNSVFTCQLQLHRIPLIIILIQECCKRVHSNQGCSLCNRGMNSYVLITYRVLGRPQYP
jgi:hypothetical protein